MTGAGREGQTYDGTSHLVRYANFVKLPHTVFALPFALVGVVLASRVAPVTLPMAVWVIVAFTAARFAAMGFNRIADRHWDALNPRTAMRELPRGVMTVREATASVVAACVVFVFAAWRINPLCFALSPIALVIVLFLNTLQDSLDTFFPVFAPTIRFAIRSRSSDIGAHFRPRCSVRGNRGREAIDSAGRSGAGMKAAMPEARHQGTSRCPSREANL